MATGDNAIVPLFEPGGRVTCRATAAISAGHFVAPSGDFEGGPAISVATPLVGGNLIKVAHCGAGLKALGVAVYDAAADGDPVPVLCGSKIIVPMVSTGAIAAGAQVQSDATGQAVVLSSGIALGLAVSAAASNIVYVQLN
jgi:hypothetical protein